MRAQRNGSRAPSDAGSASLFESIRAEAGRGRGRLLLAANVSGIANVLILVSINASAHASEARDGRAFLVFLLLIALYALCARVTKHRITVLIESMLHRIKLRVGERLAQAELEVLERVHAAEICDRVTENVTLISDRAGAIASLLQSIVIMAFAAVYLACLSVSAFALIALVFATGASLFIGMRRDLVEHTRRSAGIRVTFLERLMDLLSGFKEIQFSRQRGREIRADVLEASEALRDVSVRSSDLIADGLLVGDGILLVALAAIVFTLHAYVDLDAWTVTHLVAAVMFLWGPFMGLAGGIMPYTRSNLALAQIHRLVQRLEGAVRGGAPALAEVDPWGGRAATIDARAIEYVYASEAGGEAFRIGPLDLTVAPGEVVFIVGGNGSGKSTLLKVLTSLYAPSAGELRVGGTPVRPENVAAYRDMISAIFSDFHLFPRLYGVRDDPDTITTLLARMHLTGKTSVVGGGFTTMALSTGQRKRMAMIVAQLEDRPICVFDEWAADQDPEFRSYFYDQLLPQLRRAGKVLLVVSHDDRYFDRADRVVHMEYGKIRAVEDRRTPGGAT